MDSKQKKEKQQVRVTAQRYLIVVRGVSLDAVSHEESVGAGRDEGMTRSYNLKAQETERSQQGCCRREDAQNTKQVNENRFFDSSTILSQS